MRVKDAPHSVPTLCSPIKGRFSSASGWHCMLCSIWHRWDLSRWVYRSISVYPIKSKDHSRILGSCGFLSSYCVVLWVCISCFGLQESGWRSAMRQRDTLVQTVYHLLYCTKSFLNQAPASVVYFCFMYNSNEYMMTCRPAHTKLLSESKCPLAPTFCSQGSQPLTWAPARCSCWAECLLCPFWAITHAASLPWTFRTLPPSLLSSAPAPLAVVVCRSTGRHTWGVTQRVCLSCEHTFYNIYQDYAAFLRVFECFLFLFLFISCTCDPTLSYH